MPILHHLYIHRLCMPDILAQDIVAVELSLPSLEKSVLTATISHHWFQHGSGAVIPGRSSTTGELQHQHHASAGMSRLSISRSKQQQWQMDNLQQMSQGYKHKIPPSYDGDYATFKEWKYNEVQVHGFHRIRRPSPAITTHESRNSNTNELPMENRQQKEQNGSN